MSCAIGYKLILAENGKQALDYFEKLNGGIDQFITDVVMPELVAHEITDPLRRRAPRLPVLFMSGYDGSSEEAQDSDPEITKFIQKPFKVSALASLVDSILSGGTRGSA